MNYVIGSGQWGVFLRDSGSVQHRAQPGRAQKRRAPVSSTLALFAMSETCRLCNCPSILRDSHVVPSFVFRQHKKTSATGYLRYGQSPNRRVQDGIRKKWLCDGCEARLSLWEDVFARKVFHPLIANPGQTISYREWMARFCVSVSWRVLLHYAEEDQLKHLTPSQAALAENALAHWAAFLRGEEPSSGPYDQHFISIDAVVPAEPSQPPANLTRYVRRSIDLDIPSNGDEVFVYAKLMKFLVIGFIKIDYVNEWIGTRVDEKKGRVGMGSFEAPIGLGQYIFDRCSRYSELQGSISPAQRTKIATSVHSDWNRAKRSETFEAIDNDIRLFGDDAVRKEREGGERER